jgi:hypothetical protein
MRPQPEARRLRAALASPDARTRAVAARAACPCHGSFDLLLELEPELHFLAYNDPRPRVRAAARHVLSDALVVNVNEEARARRDERRESREAQRAHRARARAAARRREQRRRHDSTGPEGRGAMADPDRVQRQDEDRGPRQPPPGDFADEPGSPQPAPPAQAASTRATSSSEVVSASAAVCAGGGSSIATRIERAPSRRAGSMSRFAAAFGLTLRSELPTTTTAPAEQPSARVRVLVGALRLGLDGERVEAVQEGPRGRAGQARQGRAQAADLQCGGGRPVVGPQRAPHVEQHPGDGLRRRAGHHPGQGTTSGPAPGRTRSCPATL